ncbi:hypothetical protein YUYDRAFT_07443 [Streptomyces sp. ScaeMP-e48]|uniref:hypothetical protein n=1 Tax=Streptomyces sp. ScaeMP-e48 TaxID=1100823 RepID=UPI000823F3D8|nr:hypothetical protein [Streptomyces sp. ScaeMP-e48]NYS17241.1 hypothetical protein [Streptomyces sp. SJ1-7]SCK56092.1 hypothetical protein YUYDRAFT_07443 [Streptomyces sp. ScaeMP-e48]
MTRRDRSQEPLLSLRSAVVFLIGIQTAAAAGILTFAADSLLPTSALAAGATVAFTRIVIG